MKMENLNKYQGIAIIDDDSEGPCITLYGAKEKENYDLDIKEGKQPDGRIILKSRWLDKPSDRKTIEEVATRLFNESQNKIFIGKSK